MQAAGAIPSVPVDLSNAVVGLVFREYKGEGDWWVFYNVLCKFSSFRPSQSYVFYKLMMLFFLNYRSVELIVINYQGGLRSYAVRYVVSKILIQTYYNVISDILKKQIVTNGFIAYCIVQNISVQVRPRCLAVMQ